MKYANWLYLLAAFAVSAAFFLLYGRNGFNYSDEGYVLSLSNRLLHGQIPHLDFTSLRPVGSALFHQVDFLFPANYIFLCSRAVFWLEMTLISILWIAILIFYLPLDLEDPVKVFFLKLSLFVLTFVYNTHIFPQMAWHTIDGLFFALLGFYCLIVFERFVFAGFLFLGYSFLCKQGFIALLPVAMILKPKKIKFIFLSLLPLALYISWISSHAGWPCFKIQMSAHTEIMEVGVINYLKRKTLYAGMISGMLFTWVANTSEIKARYANMLLLSGVFSLLFIVLYGYYSFFLFGFLFMLLPFNQHCWRPILLALSMAWCVSISVGFAYPALCVGIMLSLVFVMFNDKLASYYSYIPITLLSVLSFVAIRNGFNYLDKPKKDLYYPLTGLIDGADGIYTSKNIYELAKETARLKKKYVNISLQPDFAGTRVFTSHQNIIASDWCNPIEIPNDTVLYEMTKNLKKDSSEVFGVAKYFSAAISNEFIKYENVPQYENKLMAFIRSNYKVKEETEFFIIYSK